MSSYIPGDPAGIYSKGRGPGLMTTPRVAVPGYGASPGDLPGGWGAFVGGAALGALIQFGVIYGVASAVGSSKPGKVAAWSALLLAGTGLVLSLATLSAIPASNVTTS